MCILSMASWGARRKGTEVILLDCDSSREVEEDANVRLGTARFRRDTLLPRDSLTADLVQVVRLPDMVVIL